MYALLKSDPFVKYHIDSLRVFGKIKIKTHFLRQYLDVQNGCIYNGGKLRLVDKKISNLPFVKASQPS
jgi:hypothetical protein